MQKIKFIKMHGLGNDFIIIDKRLNNVKITDNLIQKLSDRRTGVGSDQVITISYSPDKNTDVTIGIYNPSGDRAEACGNGTRCVAKLLFKEQGDKEIFKIASDAGTLIAKKRDGNISVNMGKISSNWKTIPLSHEMDTLSIPISIEGFSNGIGVNIGNPHVVFFGDSIDKVDLNHLGPEIENHKFFPDKTNVEFIEVISSKKIKMKVWERNAGATLACGSGACAAVYAGWKKNLIENIAEVQLPRGSLHIEIINEEAVMTGPAEISYEGYVEV